MTDVQAQAPRSEAAIAEWRETASPHEREALDLYVGGKVKLPAIPKVAAKLVPMLSRANADVAECVRLIEVDPVLASAMLKCANSAAFFRGIATTNIRDAVMRIGLKGSAALALSLSTTALYDARVKKALEFIGSDYETEWRRSVMVAHAARDIAAHLGNGDAELAFTGGLFRNVGDSLAAFILATMAVKDEDLAALPMGDRIRIVGRLRGVLMMVYIERESLPETLSQICRDIDAPDGVSVDPTTSVIRVAIGLTTPPDFDPAARQEALTRALAAAQALGLTKVALDEIKGVVTAAKDAVDAFAGQLKAR